MGKLKFIRKRYTAGLLFSILLLSGCMGGGPFDKMPPDYFQGKHRAEQAAKIDAANERCRNYSRFLRFANVYADQHLKRHLRNMEHHHSPEFIQGFKDAYPNEYMELVEFYCSD